MQTSDYQIFGLKDIIKSDLTQAISRLVFEDEYSPIWQTTLWSQFLKDTGAVDDVFFVISKDETVSCCLQKRSLGGGKYGLFCLGGPIGDNTDIRALAEQLSQLGTSEGCLFVQMEPLTDAHQIFENRKAYKRFIEPVTALIDLSQAEDRILESMKPKGRYNIRLAQKHDIGIRCDNSLEAVDTFFDLLTQTTQRNHFHGNAREYYQKLCKVCEDQNIGGLYLAYKDDTCIAASIFTFLGNMATYYYGASTNDNELRKYMPSYALQWHAIQEGKKRGCQWFDFLGIAAPGDTKSHLAGVTDFKLKFGPIIHTWPETQMIILQPVSYTIFRMLKYLKSWIK